MLIGVKCRKFLFSQYCGAYFPVLQKKNVQIVLQGQSCYLINYVTKNVNFYVLLDPRHCVARGGVSKEQPDREAVGQRLTFDHHVV